MDVEYREIKTLEELEAHFRLRHRVFSHSGYLEPEPGALDVDPFDLHSRFVGAFVSEGRQERMVGAVRMVLQYEYSPSLRALVELLDRQGPVLCRRTFFPSQSTFDFSDLLGDDSRRIVEFSRTVCDPDARGLSIGRNLVWAVYAMALNQGVDLGLGCCPPQLLGFYEKLGCRVLQGVGQGHLSQFKQDVVALAVDIGEFASRHPFLLRAAEAMRQAGRLKLCSDPRCLELHAESGLHNQVATVGPSAHRDTLAGLAIE